MPPPHSNVRRHLLFLALAALVVLVFLLWPRDGQTPTDAHSGGSSDSQSKIENPKSKITPSIVASGLALALNSPAHDIHADLRLVDTMLETYRSNFLAEGNPVGNNREITAALTGENRFRLVLIPPPHPAIDARGELCDRWGTPFFFHAESGTRMEIRSAGPDRAMFTSDDAVLSP